MSQFGFDKSTAFVVNDIHCHDVFEETVSLDLRWLAGLDSIGYCRDLQGNLNSLTCDVSNVIRFGVS